MILEFPYQLIYDACFLCRDIPLPKINSYLVLIVFSLVLFLPGVVNLPVIDRDEAHFSQATRQMVQTGQYFQIRFQEKTRFQKPPGINWLQAVSVKIFSDGDASVIWPYRIPSLLGALLSVLLTFYFARRFVSERAALLGAGFLASSLLLLVEAHMAVIDTTLLSSVLMMQGALWVIYHAGTEKKQVYWGWALLFWLAMAYGLLLKGVTPLVGVLSVSALCIVERRIDWLRGLRIHWGLLLFIAISLAWLMLINSAEHSNYLMQMIQKDLLPKLQGGHESHGKPPLFHLAILPLTFWPASLFLWQGAVYAFKNRQQQVVRFLLAWILPTWVFFEAMPTKLPQYVLPTFPAVALLCALAVISANALSKPSKWLRSLQILWGVLSFGLAMALCALPFLLLHEITVISVLVFLVISIMSIVCVYFAWNGAYRRASVAILLTAFLAYPFIFSGLFPQLKPLWISRNVVQLINTSELSEKKPLLVVGYSEPSLVFALNTKYVRFVDDDDVAVLLKNHPNNIILVNQENLTQIEKRTPLYIVLAQSKGFNYSKGKWVVLFLIKRN